MRSLFATCAAVAVTAAFAMPVPAGAAEKRADGVRNVEQMDVSAQRRYRRYYAPTLLRPALSALRRIVPNLTTRRTTPTRRVPTTGLIIGPGVGVGVGPFGFGLGF